MKRPGFGALATQLSPRATWGKLDLSPGRERALREMAIDVAQRKENGERGIGALFVGQSGRGKPMAAEVLAKELRLDLYRVDLSAVMSKYIGETEKNLRRLFEAAESGGPILFFDEADALFGKRTKVKDGHDRYANVDINYLLQLVESYGGLSIFGTSKKSALDEPFLRRLRFVVSFRKVD